MRQFLAVLIWLYASVTWASEPLWIDVRSPTEFNAGHVDGAHHIPFDQIESGIHGLDVNKDSEIYLYCGAGGRAQVAKESLERRGYTNVINAGGLEEARDLSAQQQR